jgi:hypothetical protein
MKGGEVLDPETRPWRARPPGRDAVARGAAAGAET